MGPCPIHGGDNPTAFVVTPSRGSWCCFSRCGRGGDIVELVRLLDRVDHRQAWLTLNQVALQADDSSSELPLAATTRPPSFPPFVRRLPLDPTAPWLARRGIRPGTAARFEAGAYAGGGMLQRCMAVRLHDLDGSPLGDAGRRLDDDDARQRGKWVFPPRLPKHQLLYGHHRSRATADTRGFVVVVECSWGVMRLAQLDLPAVALLGTALSATQRAALGRFRRVILLLDGDRAGYDAAPRIAATLRAHTTAAVDTAMLPAGCDPDDLTDAALLRCLQPLLS